MKNVTAGTNHATLSYVAPGGVSTMTTGNNVVQTLTWNDRAQPTYAFPAFHPYEVARRIREKTEAVMRHARVL